MFREISDGKRDKRMKKQKVNPKDRNTDRQNKVRRLAQERRKGERPLVIFINLFMEKNEIFQLHVKNNSKVKKIL